MTDSRSIRSARIDARRLQGRRLQAFVRDRWQDRSGIRGLADQVGVSRATLYAWFNGTSAPDTSQLASLADALGSSPTELVTAMSGADVPRTIDERMIVAGWAEPAGGTETGRPASRWTDDTARPTAHLNAPRFEGALRVERQSLFASPVAGVASPRPRPSPLLVDLFRNQVVDTCQVVDPIGPVARRMYERSYSQLPAYDGHRLVGLLTTDAIARWYASGARRGKAKDQTPVRRVLEFAEDGRAFRLLGPDASAADVVDLFDEAARRGYALDAVLVTSTGGPAGQPRSIVTSFDLPRIHSAR